MGMGGDLIRGGEGDLEGVGEDDDAGFACSSAESSLSSSESSSSSSVKQ